jgi:hypothetical protein
MGSQYNIEPVPSWSLGIKTYYLVTKTAFGYNRRTALVSTYHLVIKTFRCTVPYQKQLTNK